MLMAPLYNQFFYHPEDINFDPSTTPRFLQYFEET